MTLDQQIAHILHDLHVPPLSAEADALRESIAEMAAAIVRDSGCDPGEVLLSRGPGTGNVYVTVAGSDEYGG